MVMQNKSYFAINFIAESWSAGASPRTPKSGYYQFLFSIFLVDFFFHHPFDTVEAFPDFGEGGVERCKSQADVVGFAEVGDDVHVFDQGTVDAVAVRVADADMGAALSGITRGAEGEAEGGKQFIGQKRGVVCHQNGFEAAGIYSNFDGDIE